MLDHVARGNMTLERLIDMTSAGVQRVFGLVGKGRIAAGYDADFTVIDRKGRFTITEDWVESRCGWSPFTGMDLRGRVVGTIIRGHSAMRSEEHTSELQSLMRNSYAVFCLKKKKQHKY